MREFAQLANCVASWPIALLLAKNRSQPNAALLANRVVLAENRQSAEKICKQRGKVASGEYTTTAPRSRANRAHNCHKSGTTIAQCLIV
jgi:hypothetical protein